MELTSAIRIARPAPEVLDALLDAGKVASCLPGSRLIGEVAEGTYAGEIALRIGPVEGLYAGTIHLDDADRDAGTATMRASGRERGGQGSADAELTLRVESHGTSTRVLVSADLVIRGAVAKYAAGAIGEVGQRLMEEFAGNIEDLLVTEAGQAQPGTAQAGRAQARRAAAGAGAAESSNWVTAGRHARPAIPLAPGKTGPLAAAVGAAALAGGIAAIVIWRRLRGEPPQVRLPRHYPGEGEHHG
ncbi:MAG TPA: SRPBCC family protein [Streptosporangiaceae bacterium]|nr:SRPBCC family protein [Streptosporangiaceae bacterium]